jgi:hypothetical protein
MVEGSTSHLEQVQAITTLRSGKEVNTHVEEKKDEKTEAPQNQHKDKGKQVSIEASSSFVPTPEIPYEPRVPIVSQGTLPLQETRRENTRHDGGLQVGQNQHHTH